MLRISRRVIVTYLGKKLIDGLNLALLTSNGIYTRVLTT